MTTQAPTRQLTKRELWTIAIVLSTAIARDSDKLIRAKEHNLAGIYDRVAQRRRVALRDHRLRPG